MSIEDYLNKMKNIHEYILKFVDCEDSIEDCYRNLKNLFDELKIKENKHELKSILHLILNISNNHHRTHNFFDRIGQILNIFKDQITSTFSNIMIFNIFKSNKRILLLLIELKIIVIDDAILYEIEVQKYVNLKYIHYFFPEVKSFFDPCSVQKITEGIPEGLVENIEKFYEIRKEGENDFYICSLIRNDSIEDFISYVNQTNIPLNSKINISIFETNQFLINKSPSLIEYSAFFGSIQIFQYLQKNNVELTPSLWLYAIHSKDPEFINILEENHILPPNDSYLKCLEESIKCHHNDIANYIKNNYLSSIDDYVYKEEKSNENGEEEEHNDDEESSKSYGDPQKLIPLSSINYYNFALIQTNYIDKYFFYELCYYDYFQLVEILLKTCDIDLNAIYVRKIYIF